MSRTDDEYQRFLASGEWTSTYPDGNKLADEAAESAAFADWKKRQPAAQSIELAPAETEPEVPSAFQQVETEAGDLILRPWRTGHIDQTLIYAMLGTEPSHQDICIGNMHHPSYAVIAVLNHNNEMKRQGVKW